MPIKFRCQHCRQFLGISRSKAGEVFDCPTCGWTLRVPDLDGSIKPLPSPGLDMGDSKLAKALDEVALAGGLFAGRASQCSNFRGVRHVSPRGRSVTGMQ